MDRKQWPSVDVVAVVRIRVYEMGRLGRFIFRVRGTRKMSGVASGGLQYCEIAGVSMSDS